jgi:hypothetical protein
MTRPGLEELPDHPQSSLQPKSSMLKMYNASNYIILCCLNVAQFGFSQMQPTTVLHWVRIGIDVAWFPLAGIMFIINFAYRGHE